MPEEMKYKSVEERLAFLEQRVVAPEPSGLSEVLRREHHVQKLEAQNDVLKKALSKIWAITEESREALK